MNLFKLQMMIIELYKKLPSLAPNLELLSESSCFRAIEEESDRWGRQLKARLLVWSQRLRESEEWTEYVSLSGCIHIQFCGLFPFLVYKFFVLIDLSLVV